MGFLSKFAISVVLAVVITSGIAMLFTSMTSAYGQTFSIIDVSSQMSEITNKTSNFQQQMQTAITTINPLNFIATTVLTPLSLLFDFINMFSTIMIQIVTGLAGNSFMPNVVVNGIEISYVDLISAAVTAIIAIRIGKTVVDAVFKSDI